MEIWQALADNWFTALQSLGIITSFLYTAAAYRADEKSRRVANRLTVEDHHRNLWAMCASNPKLNRVLDPKADVLLEPVTDSEFLFCNTLIVHLSGSYLAIKKGMLDEPERLREDVSRFFALPVPSEAWKKFRTYQDDDFIEFVETLTHARVA